MFQSYSWLSTCFGVIFSPFLLAFGLRKKYRKRLLGRLGFGLRSCLSQNKTVSDQATPTPCIWIHALSVGEVTSALPLVQGVRAGFPQARVVFSAGTSSGQQVAKHLLGPWVDALIPGPLDLAPVVQYFIKTIKPDLFVLVETDFWPNWLSALAQRQVPLVLVNGRISDVSFQRYQRLEFFFRPLFTLFALLSMQTTVDAESMKRLGIPPHKIRNLGNLKFDTSRYSIKQKSSSRIVMRLANGFRPDAPLWICGSTHRGEEKVLLTILKRLRVDFPNLQLLLAPRNIERSEEVMALATSLGLPCRRRSLPQKNSTATSVLVLDTLGELAELYQLADLAFIGGSLVAAGGHNPLEAATCAVPVCFGPHMEDFAEIAQGLYQSGGGCQVDSAENLYEVLRFLLAKPQQQEEMGFAAQNFVLQHQGVVQQHIAALHQLLP